MYGINAVVIAAILVTFIGFNRYTRRNLGMDIICLVLLFLVSSSTYFNAEGFKGWPTIANIQKGYLVSTLVIEPDVKQTGAIYLWVSVHQKTYSSLDKFWTYLPSDNAPRAYAFPYSKEMAKDAHESQRELNDGMIVEVGGKPQKGELSTGSNSMHPVIISPEDLLTK